MINLIRRHLFSIKKTKSFRNSDVKCGSVALTIIAMLGGASKPRIKTPVVKFKNDCCSDPIHGLLNTLWDVLLWMAGPT